ncbi:MAG: hypothetical protein IPL39_03645 [Opitutaceae bacterium]|nr:hypothetical protein [Opitutaceae bacterium]
MPLKEQLRRALACTRLDRLIDLSRLNVPRERRLCRRRTIHRGAAAHELIGQLLRSGAPAALGKLGDVEVKALSWHFGVPRFYAVNRAVPSFGDQELFEQAGVFPKHAEVFHRFCERFAERLPDLDVCGLWHNPGEFTLTERFCPLARWTDLTALEPWFHPAAPWSAALAGKRVLVVHPFADSIRTQYPRRGDIWRSLPGLLPDFELLTLRSPYGFSANEFSDWFAMLAWLENRVTALARDPGFDIALIGCGAAGIPLAVHVKRLGAIGLHTGGPTQLFFGIRGGRWDRLPAFTRYFNDAWIRPQAEETPKEAPKVDHGGYW